MLTISNEPKDYLASSRYIDWEQESVRQKAQELRCASGSGLDLIERTYCFVRDEIKHSWDVQDKRVTVTASDTLREKVGICWAKANLLAGLLRANGVPAGICYQRLTLGDTPESGYCIHALNAVYLKELDRWIRIDARGNKAGVDAQLDLQKEKLAFCVRPEMGEIDYQEVYAEPLPVTMEVLESSADALFMCLHSLPGDIK